MQLFQHVIRTIFGIFLDALMFLQLCLPTATVAAENLFLRKQLGLFVERKVKARWATDSIRFTLARLSRWFDWREALIVVKPDTLILWHRKGFRLFWKWKSRPRGRPRVPAQLRMLIVEMARRIQLGGQERIADELLLKIGIRISPRTVRRYMPEAPQRPADPKQGWMTPNPNPQPAREKLAAPGPPTAACRVRHGQAETSSDFGTRLWAPNQVVISSR